MSAPYRIQTLNPDGVWVTVATNPHLLRAIDSMDRDYAHVAHVRIVNAAGHYVIGRATAKGNLQ